jgi:hypothetical protein
MPDESDHGPYWLAVLVCGGILVGVLVVRGCG